MKRHAPAAQRNREPIAEVLREALPASGTVLEVASGTGEHSAWFARLFPALRWQPSDFDPAALASIRAWHAETALDNLMEPAILDASSSVWPVETADAILCVNMVHISPWEATEGLMRGAGRLLPLGGPLILYGPYRRAVVPTAPSNDDFDRSLKSRDPRWGLRNLEDVAAEAALRSLVLERIFELPANNIAAVFRKA